MQVGIAMFVPPGVFFIILQTDYTLNTSGEKPFFA